LLAAPIIRGVAGAANVSDSAFPVRIGGCDTSGAAWDVALSGTLAFVADGNGGLQVVDVSNPSAPIRIDGRGPLQPRCGYRRLLRGQDLPE